MDSSNARLECPHCSQALREFALPEGTGWEQPTQWACFNDDCPYYRKGWDWMWDRYAVRGSYRYRVVDRETNRSSPLAVWSETACRDRIVETGE